MIQKYLVVKDCASGCPKRRHVILRKGLEVEFDSDQLQIKKWVAKGYLRVINNDENLLHNDQTTERCNDQ
jgi:hypothetical protein